MQLMGEKCMNNKCCGCSACALACPKNAIEMKINSEGFYRPIINKEKCINCGVCNKVCFYETGRCQAKILANKGLYSAYTLNIETRQTTSSGGIANEIAKYYLKNNKNVCAVIYDDENRVAKHINITANNLDEVHRIKGSKYIQSLNYEGFKNALESNEECVVFGTPCQIAGFRKIIELKKAEEKFLLIDIYCHGVPTYNLWNKYLDKITKKYGIHKNPKVIFREKKLGWHNYYMKIYDDKKEYVRIRDKDIFYMYFLNSMCNSQSCYECEFRNDSCADIRLGDFWGKRYEKDEKGYSMVCINTLKGKELIEKLKNVSIEQVDVAERFGQQTKQSLKPSNYKKNIDKLKRKKYNFLWTSIKYNFIYYYRNIKKTVKKILKGEM